MSYNWAHKRGKHIPELIVIVFHGFNCHLDILMYLSIGHCSCWILNLQEEEKLEGGDPTEHTSVQKT